VEFSIAKTEAILLTKKKDKRHPKMKIKLGNGKKIPYNKGTTRWLRFWIDLTLNVNEHFTKRMAKAHQREAEIKRLYGTYGMNPGNIRTIMTATIQTQYHLARTSGGEKKANKKEAKKCKKC
jgi:hypothetical protein